MNPLTKRASERSRSHASKTARLLARRLKEGVKEFLGYEEEFIKVKGPAFRVQVQEGVGPVLVPIPRKFRSQYDTESLA